MRACSGVTTTRGASPPMLDIAKRKDKYRAVIALTSVAQGATSDAGAAMLFLAAWWGFAIVPPEATQQTSLGANEPQPYELYESYYYDMPVGSVLDLEFNQTSLRE